MIYVIENAQADVVEWIAELGNSNQEFAEGISTGIGVVFDGADFIVNGFGVKNGSLKILTKFDKYVSVPTNVIGNSMSKIPKSNKIAKTIALGDVVNNLNNMYKDVEENINQFLEDLFND